MAEIGLGIALVAVVGIAGLTMLGGSIQDGLGSHQASLDTSDLSAQLAAKNMPVLPDSPVTSPLAQPSTAAANGSTNGSNLGLTLGNGQYIDLGNYPVDLGQSIETAGANGTTTMLLATMDSMIQQAADNKTLTSEEANALKALSKQGHLIADIQVKVEDGNYSADVYDGGLGFNEGAKTEGFQTERFLNLLKKAKSSGSLKDPVLNQSISLLVNQIVNIANGVEGAAYAAIVDDFQYPSKLAFNKAVASMLNQRDIILGINTQQTLLNLGAGVVSHQKANQICQAGKAGDNCKR